MAEQHHLRQFLLLVFILLLPCFALWTVFSGPLAMPAIGFTNMLLSSWFPDVVNGFYAQGSEGLLLTEFGEAGGEPVPLGQSEYLLGFSVDPRIVSYSIPFYTALHFATRREHYLGSYCQGLLILYLLMWFALICICLKELMVTLGSLFLEQSSAWVPHPNVIALLYQFSVLVLPALAPVLLWGWQSRESPLVKELLDQEQPAEA